MQLSTVFSSCLEFRHIQGMGRVFFSTDILDAEKEKVEQTEPLLPNLFISLLN